MGPGYRQNGNGDLASPNGEDWIEKQRIADAKLKDLEDDELRQRLFIELEGYLDEEGRAKVSAAFELAKYAHEGQMRSPGTHISHSLRNAIRIASYFDIRDADMISAALLHDTVEDQPERILALVGESSDNREELRERSLEILGETFGEDVSDMVGSVTTPFYDGSSQDKNQFYLEFVKSQIHDPRFFVLKISDFVDNGVGLKHTNNDALKSRLALKYDPLFEVFADRLDEVDNPIPPDASERLKVQLFKAQERNRGYVKPDEFAAVGA